MPEFGQHGLEVLRQPLEDKIVTISRAQGSLTFPANFMLVGAQESMPLRLPGRSRAPLHVQPHADQPLPEAPLRPAARPDRYPLGGDPGTRRGGTRARANGPVQQREGWLRREPDHQRRHGPDPGARSLSDGRDRPPHRRCSARPCSGRRPGDEPERPAVHRHLRWRAAPAHIAMSICNRPRSTAAAATDGMIGQPDYGFTPARWLTPFRSPERRG